MQELLAAVNNGEYEGVIVMEIERLARGDTIDQGVVAQAFKSSDTKIITPVKVYDPNNEYDEEYFEFSLFMSRREYKTIRRRMQAGRLQSVKEGNYIASSPPYGYKKIHPEPKVYTLEIVPEEAEIVKLIFELYLSGKGGKAISTELNKMGIPPQKSDKWEKPSIKKILANPLYIGKVQWKTKSNGDICYNAKHPAIISENAFSEVQSKQKSKDIPQTTSQFELLNYYHGILYCGNCEHQLRRRSINGKVHMLCLYNQCRNKVVSSKLECLDEAIIEALKQRVDYLKSNQKEIALTMQSKSDKRKPLLAEQTKLQGQQIKLYELLEQGIYDTNLFLERSTILKERLQHIEKQLQEQESEQFREQKMSPEKAIAEIQCVIKNFCEVDESQKNELLKRVIKQIYYYKTERACYHKKETDLKLEIDFL